MDKNRKKTLLRYTVGDFKQTSGRIIPVCKVKELNGKPTLFLEGKPLAGMAFQGGANWPEVNSQIARTGIVIFTPVIPLGWQGPGDFDYQKTDALFAALLKEAPQALILPRISLNPTVAWQKAHPEELCLFHDAPRDPESVKRIFEICKHDPLGWQQGEFTGQSFASQVWKEEASEALLRFLDHVTLAPYAAHIIGYHFSFGISGESQLWGGWPGKFADYSQPMRREFGKWLGIKYGHNINLLRKAWHEEIPSFANVQIPSKQERMHTSMGIFRDIGQEAKVVNYHECMSDITSDNVLYFAKLLKAATDNRTLAGIFYGYILECLSQEPLYGLSGCDKHSDGCYMNNSGHLKVKKILDSPYVDFIAAPSPYPKRSIGEAGGCMTVDHSVILHHKLWFNEADIRTHMSNPDSGFGRVDTAAHSTAVLRREFAYILTHKANLWWMDQGRKWFSDPATLKDIGQMKQIADRALPLNRNPKPVAEGIAVIVDDRSYFYTSLTNELFLPLIYTQRDPLARIGAPYHLYLFDDLANPDMPDYKMYLFLNTFCMDKQQRETISKKVKRAGNVAVWAYASGFLNPHPDIDALAEMTGMKMTIADSNAPFEITMCANNHPITKNIRMPMVFGAKQAIKPRFCVNDPQAVTLGKFADGQAGVAVKEMGQWTSVYIAAPDIPPGLLRGIAETAGVHVYFDQDQVLFADEHFIAIHTNRDVEGILRLPRKADLHDVYADKLIASGKAEVALKIPSNTTVMYQLK